MLVIEHGRRQYILAIEMIVKGSFRDTCGFGNGIHAHTGEPFLVEKLVRGREYPASRGAG
jgi:hypothetical protein